MYPPDNPDLSLLQQASGQEDTPPPVEPDPIQEKQNQDTKNEQLEEYLKIICDLAEKEDLDLRYGLLGRAKRNELYFNNIQNIIYDETAKDYRTLDDVLNLVDGLPGASDIKINNIYRALAESLIAALSIDTPAVEFTPDDAQNPEDLETAEAYTHVAELVARHNKSKLILIRALTLLFNQGTIAGYNFAKTDSAYGNLKTYKGSKQRQIPVIDIRCPNCAELLDSSIPAQKFNPDAPVDCSSCGFSGPPTPYQVMDNIEEPIYESTPKCRSLYDVFGITAVKLPLYAKDQASCGYLILRVDDHLAKFKMLYDKEGELDLQSGSGDTEKYERWARLPISYTGTIPQHLTTARYVWLRPWYFFAVNDNEKAVALLEEYPTGVMVTLIDDKIVEVSHEKLDDVWTVTIDPKSNFIHAEPAGNAIIPLQDVENDVFNLGVQSIEHGIPETFVNPKVVNFDAYSKSPSAPGMLTKATPPGPDKSIADGFYTLKPAVLSNEYSAFTQSLTAKTQFTSGAFPSIYGGSMGDKGDTTATEYTESRARALQRIGLTWQMISYFWGDLTFKSVKMFIQNMAEDESYSKKQKGTFVQVFISKSSLNGSVGHVEPEVNGQLPQSWAQKKDFIMRLIEMANPEIGKILLHPNNSELIKLGTGMPDIYIPGENDAQKQYAEYYELSVTVSPDGITSSIPIDLHVDDHAVHMQILKNKLVSMEGVQLYKTNPDGYQNNILHYVEHETALQAKTMAVSGMSPENTPAESATATTQG